MGEEVAHLFRDALDHAIPLDRRREAESLLQRFALTPEGLQWALNSIEYVEQQALQDPQVLFFAASILEGAAAPHYWHKLPFAEKSNVKRCLWGASLFPKQIMPSFVTSKLVSAMATLACTDYDSTYWTQLAKICQEGPGRQQALRLLDASIERLRYIAYSGITGQQGMVLYSELPMLQPRLKEVHLLALDALTSLVQQLVSDTSPCCISESDAVILQAFKSLQIVLGGLSAVPTQDDDDDDIGLRITHAVVLCISRLEGPSPSEADYTLATAAMACFEELLPRPRSVPAVVRIIQSMLYSMHSTCEKWAERRRLLRTGSIPIGDDDGEADCRAVVGLVRVLCQVLQQMGKIASHEKLVDQTFSALEAAVNVIIAAGRPGDMLLLAELWYPVLSHLNHLEEIDYVTNRPEGSSEERHGQPYRNGITSTASLMVSTYFSEQSSHVPPFFHASQLSDEPGSGAELTELLAGVSFGEDLEASISETVVERKNGEEWEERRKISLYDTTWPSERQVYARHVELFFSHAVSTYASILAPLGLQHLRESMQTAGEAGMMLAQGNLTNENAPAYRFAFDKLKFSLGIARACVPLNHFQWRGDESETINSGDDVLNVATSSGSALAKLQLLDTMIQFGKDWIITAQHIVQRMGGMPPEGHAMYSTVASFVMLVDDIFKTVTVLLSHVMPAAVEGGAENAQKILMKSLDLINDAVVLSCGISSQPNCSAASTEVANAAATCLHTLTAMNLFFLGSFPLDTLKAACSSPYFTSLHALAVLCIPKQDAMLTSTLCLLWSGLSDLVLRIWATPLQSKKASIAENTSQYASLMLPLVETIKVVHVSGGLGEQILCRAASVAAAVIESFTGSPKIIRGIAFSTFVHRVILGAAELLRSGTASAHPRVLPPLLRMMAAALRTFSPELGTTGIGELLGELMPAFCNSAQHVGTSNDPECTAELAFLDLVAESLSFGAGKHHALVPPALEFGLTTLERVGQGGACHVKAQILCSLTSILCNNWRYVVPPPPKEGESAAPLPAPAMAVLLKVSTFFSDAAEERSMPSIDDIRKVLEELYELHVVSKIYWRPDFAHLRESLLYSLLAVLLGRMFTGAQTQVIDSIYALASANWSSFLLEIFPTFIQMRMGELGARGPELAALHFEVTDQAPGVFESALLAFVNDATFWKRCL